MNILIIAPKVQSNNSGNQATAKRWQQLLIEARHQVEISDSFQAQIPDILIAIHLRKSHQSIVDFKSKFPSKPLITLGAGTDLYRDLSNQKYIDIIKKSIKLSDTILVLQNLATSLFDEEAQKKVTVIYQSTDIDSFPTKVDPHSDKKEFRVVVIGHPREIKDSLRAALASRELPSHSNIKVKLCGKPANSELLALIQQEAASNSRFHWQGELSRKQTWSTLRSSDVMVISSLGEGGANVVSEACVIGLPVLATKIDGNIGLLGEGYQGYFQPRGTKQLSSLMLRCEQNKAFLQTLREQIKSKSNLFSKQQESLTLQKVILNLTS